MTSKSHENSKPIRFEGELLPNWAQLLDLAANLCLVPQDTRGWFSRFTNISGVDDARTVLHHCELLRASIQEKRGSILVELQRSRDDGQPSQIISAWMYALETMVQEARIKKTCAWIVEGAEEAQIDDSDGGDITLRRL